MKKGIIILSSLIIILIILVIIKQNKKEVIKTEKKITEQNPYQEFSYYKNSYQERYNNYKIKNPTFSDKDIVLRVNIGLDHGFYTNTSETKEFSLTMLVNKYHYVSDNFTPTNLVKVTEYSKDNMYLVKECKDAFVKMAHDASLQGYNIRAISTYRSYDYQNNLYKNYVKKDGKENADTYSARPGYSEHHTGLAIDVDNTKLSYTNFENTKEFNWMQENAYKYGFILRYPKNSDITGYTYESWHYRYVPLDIAKYIHDNNITYEEYYYEFLDKT